LLPLVVTALVALWVTVVAELSFASWVLVNATSLFVLAVMALLAL
jgi:hypothetical protein